MKPCAVGGSRPLRPTYRQAPVVATTPLPGPAPAGYFLRCAIDMPHQQRVQLSWFGAFASTGVGIGLRIKVEPAHSRSPSRGHGPGCANQRRQISHWHPAAVRSPAGGQPVLGPR
jgi:hypothetical protein